MDCPSDRGTKPGSYSRTSLFLDARVEVLFRYGSLAERGDDAYNYRPYPEVEKLSERSSSEEMALV